MSSKYPLTGPLGTEQSPYSQQCRLSDPVLLQEISDKWHPSYLPRAMEFDKQGISNNISWNNQINHWCGDSRLCLGVATSLSTFAGHMYRCDSNGSCVQEAYASTVEEVVHAYNTMFPLNVGNNPRDSERTPAGSKTGFVWIDLYGVPPPPHDTAGVDNKGDSMDHLWEALQLNQEHRVRVREEIRQEYQRRALMLGGEELDDVKPLSYAAPVTHPNDDEKTIPIAEERQPTLLSDYECFCAGYSSERGLGTLSDPDTVDLFAKYSPNSCKGKNRGECYAAMRVVTLLEHTVHQIPKMEEQMHAACLTAKDGKQCTFNELPYVSQSPYVNPFLRSSNPASGSIPHVAIGDDLHNRCDSDSSSSESLDRLLLENDEHSGAMCVGGGENTSPPQFAVTHVFCWEGLCVTWCPSATSASWNSRGCVWQVKNWGQLRETVLSHWIYSMQHLPHPEVSESNAFHILKRSDKSDKNITTASFVFLFVSTVCYAYLPNINALLSEVEAIDFMLPLIQPKMESDQSDAHRRILLLRHKLSIHRRELIFKKRLLDSLKGPSVSTLTDFMTQSFPSDYDQQESLEAIRAVYPSSTSEAVTTLDAISDTIDETLHKMDTSRMVLGNTTILYNSNVISSNSEVSNDADYFMVLVHYIFITIMPLHLIASQWGLNIYVPFKDLDSLAPFWTIVGILAVICVLTPIFPFWAYYTGRVHLLI